MCLQERCDSPTESSTDSSSVCNDENGNEGDIETNQVSGQSKINDHNENMQNI